MGLLLALLAAACLPAVGLSASLPHRIFIPGAAGSPPAAAPAPPAQPPAQPPAPAPPATPALPAPTAVAEPPVDDAVRLIDERRRAAGCGQIRRDDTLTAAAHRHSEDMALNDFMSHTGSDGSTFGQRARASGYSFFASGEIIAAGYATPAEVVQGWMNSPGHRAIMLDCRNTDVGTALVERAGAQYRYYWTAVFGRR